MSYIHLIIINDNKIYTFASHYRTAIKLLDNGLINILKKFREQKFLDAGYILIDFDSNHVINAQSAFPVSVIKKLNKMYGFNII